MRRLVLFFLLCVSITYFSKAQFVTQKKEALDIAEKAVTKMDEGDYEEAIALLEVSEEMDPKNISFTYEKAYVYYVIKKYDKVIELLTPLLDNKDANDLFYQLIGNSYDFKDDAETANNYYTLGLKKFPNSGRLYFELGTNQYRSRNYNEAISTWEKGIETDPYFPSNYYYLGKLFANTSDKVWSLIYCEIFLNLERNTDRTTEISNVLFNIYKSAFSVDKEGQVTANLTENKTIDPAKGFEIPYPVAFEVNVNMSLPKENPINETGLNIGFLNVLRTNFINNWYEHKQNKKHPTALFDFHKRMLEENQFEAYNYWLFLKGNEDEFWDWYNHHKDKYKSFETWFNENQINLDHNNVVLNKK